MDATGEVNSNAIIALAKLIEEIASGKIDVTDVTQEWPTEQVYMLGSRRPIFAPSTKPSVFKLEFVTNPEPPEDTSWLDTMKELFGDETEHEQ